MGRNSAEVEVGDASQEGVGGGGVPIGSARGRGGRKHVPPTKVSNGPQYLLEANG